LQNGNVQVKEIILRCLENGKTQIAKIYAGTRFPEQKKTINYSF